MKTASRCYGLVDVICSRPNCNACGRNLYSLISKAAYDNLRIIMIMTYDMS